MEYSSTTLVLFGISGDLSRRKILPSLINLYKKNLLPKGFHILGLSRKDTTRESIFNNIVGGFDKEILDNFMQLCEIIKIDVNDISEFKKLDAKLASYGANTQKIFYLSVPPETLPDLARSLGSTLSKDNTKILFEKPFGTDYESALKLINETREYFDDGDLYHIDHYLAKKIVKDLIRWKSSKDAENLINSGDIKKIEILSLESLGIEGRANFYDTTGALRDLIQSHLLEILAILIENPSETRDEALDKLSVKNPIRAQYKGYKEEVGNMNSTTETFASVTFYSSDPKWIDIPFTLTTGKALRSKILEINITTSDGTIKIKQKTDDVEQDEIFDYDKILFDAFRGDRTIFLGNEEILATWKLIDPIFDKWSKSSLDLLEYEKGSSMDDIMQIYENNKDK